MTTTISTGWRFTAAEPEHRRGGSAVELSVVDPEGTAAAVAHVDIADCTHQGRLSVRIGPRRPPAGVLGQLVRLVGALAGDRGARTLQVHYDPDSELAAQVMAASGLEWTVHEACEGNTAVAPITVSPG